MYRTFKYLGGKYHSEDSDLTEIHVNINMKIIQH